MRDILLKVAFCMQHRCTNSQSSVQKQIRRNVVIMSSSQDANVVNSTKISNDAVKPICVPCSSLDESHLLKVEEIENKLKTGFPLWKLVEKYDDSVPRTIHLMSRSFVTKNFQCALDCINAMGAIAEEQNHHPDLHLTNYREVEIELYTHKLGGVTENDLFLANLIDTKVKVSYSPKWLEQHPEAKQ